MKTQVYQIRAITNLHAGSGDADYGIVDKLVQRDPTTGYPTIHMSGIKGALREYFEENEIAGVTEMFGSEPKEQNKVQQGKLRFISAELLAFPRPSEQNGGQSAYDLCYVLQLLGEWLDKVKLFDTSPKIDDATWKDIDLDTFKVLTEELPVIARNQLDNGESKNLWYEEFVPRETIFGIVIQGENKLLDSFNDTVNGKVIQIGGNATVGYGYCLFTSIIKHGEIINSDFKGLVKE